jgi:uncharacterized protein (DUF1499 family)
MVRRRIAEDPISRLAIWARRVALFALVTAILGTLIVRSGFLELQPALATVAGAMVLAVIAILLALGAFVVIWIEGLGGGGSALLALVIGLGLIAYPAYLATKAYRLPAINDISTDTDNPPKLEALARVRPRTGSNPIDYPGAVFAKKQEAAYPDVEPLMLTVPPQVAFETVYGLMTRRKWLIVEARRPLPGRREGHIEAVARTPIMGFRDDIVVRLRADGDGTRVDMRSASRYGTHDFGTNAARIVAFLVEVDAAVDALPETKREPEPEPRRETPPPQPRRAPARR